MIGDRAFTLKRNKWYFETRCSSIVKSELCVSWCCGKGWLGMLFVGKSKPVEIGNAADSLLSF